MGRVFKAVEEMDLREGSNEDYLHADVKAPRMAGMLIRIFAWLMETRIIGPIAMYILKKGNLLHELFTYGHYKEPPMYFPKYPDEEINEQEVVCINPVSSPLERVNQALSCLPRHSLDDQISDTVPFFRRWTIRDFSKAYASGRITPMMVAEHFLSAVEDSSKPYSQMSIFINYNSKDILKQAAESTSRYERGEPLSILDGVPIAVKDEIDCLPYPTTGGTKWLHKFRKATDDATCVKLLRACGAMLVGKTNMHELGMGTSGINPHYGATRNPYNNQRISGGSSSGSAAAVSAGLCPAALGVDGGGSVRMPASLCGVVGLKPTFGRISHFGVLPLNWTVGMVGVLAATVEDALIVYTAICGHLPSDQLVSLPPQVNLPLLQTNNSVGDLKLAKYTKWFNDCDDNIRSTCHHALDLLAGNYGCKILEVTLPEIEEMRLAHYVTIGSECNTSIGSSFEKLGLASSGWDARFAFRVYRSFSSKEFLNAQRLRVTAYPIQQDALKYGELDYINGAALMRYQVAGNFLGLPVITVPVGYDKLGMPIGLQFIGRPWSEATLLRLAFATEVLLSQNYKMPKTFYNILD
ncbi:fatty acid amide hydrolase isoform X2 [Cryptomeria japonica]|uniref:fatty acid amide hydrolase isoform X2 n=1 Tax=Cryptomeria japonica TaxID=3369 RepID=UPI0025ABA5DE|nr:fatty acid amide hydrolase isoform X2 [Cryptomeria japonica]